MPAAIKFLNHLGGEFLAFAWPMLWQSSLLIAIVLALDLLLARKIRAAIRHALWLVVLLKLILPPALALPTGPAWWLFPAQAQTHQPGVSKYNFTIEDLPAGPEVIPQNIPLPAPPPPALNRAGWAVLAAATTSTILLCWLLLRWWQLTRQVRTAGNSQYLSDALALAAQRAGLRSRLPLKLVDAKTSPAVCGLFRPVILLPRLLAENLPTPQLHAVLLHEVIHLRRRDIWVNCAQALLQIVYWWHPLVWIANARIRRVREDAVDDAVMLALRDDAEHYAPTLLEVAKLAFRRPMLSLGLIGIMESRSALRHRIERLTDYHAPPTAGLTLASLIAILSFSAVALPMGQGPAPLEQTITTSAVRLDSSHQEVLIQAELYRLPKDNVEKLVVNLPRHERDASASSADNWWSASPEEFSLLQTNLVILGASPQLRPRIQTRNRTTAQFYVGDSMNGTKFNGTEFDCTPVIDGQAVQLAIQLTAFNGHPGLLSTNQMNLNAPVPNHGGIAVLYGPKAGQPPAQTFVIIGVEILTNTSLRHSSANPPAQAAATASDGNATHSPAMPGTQAADFQTRTFWLDTNVFLVNLRTQARDLGPLPANDSIATMFRSVLENDGIDTHRPPGISIFYGDLKGTLFVKASATDMERIEKIIMILSESSARKNILTKLDRIRIPNVSLDRMTLGEVVQRLTELAKQNDPLKDGVNFTIASNSVSSDGANILVRMSSLTDVRLADILDAVVLVADHPIKYSVQDDGVVFSAKSTAGAKLFTRTFQIDAPSFWRMSEALGTTNGSPSALFRQYIQHLGIDLASPPGKSVFYNNRLGYLFVKATGSDLDAIERALQTTNPFPTLDTVERVLQTPNPFPPQLHIKARFYDVPKNGFAGFSSSLSSTSGATNSQAASLLGILSHGNTRTAIHALQSLKDVEVLGEPEITLLSGRQAQMRATHVMTVVTNLAYQEIHTNAAGSPARNAITPQTAVVECGPIFDVIPQVLADDYTIAIKSQAMVTSFLGYEQPPKKLATHSVTNSAGEKIDVPTVWPVFQTQSASNEVNLYDDQTLVFSLNAKGTTTEISGDDPTIAPLTADALKKRDETRGAHEILVFVTVTLIDSVGNRIHSDTDMEYYNGKVPPQPQIAQPAK